MFDECTVQPVYTYVLGILLCLGSIISYIPQYYSLIKTKQHKGISELSLFILNVGSACLAANTFILNWYKFECYESCSFWICTANLLSMFQIMIGWIMVLPLYLIYIRYKIKNSDKRIIYDVVYFTIYFIFIMIMIIIGLSKEIHSDNILFFRISAYVLGIMSAICTCIVWLPQIVKLIRTKEQGNLSLIMFLMQAPGSCISAGFQILYKQSISTWGTYIVSFVEQTVIVIILLIFKYRNQNIETSETMIETESLVVNDENE